MEELFELFSLKVKNLNINRKRYLQEKIDWNQKLVIIKGTRGVGKTTLILQYVKLNCKIDASVLYINLDDIYFSVHNLTELISEFVKQGGKHIFIDQVHKYNEWNVEIKQVLNKFEKLRIVLIGTSVVDYKAELELADESSIYELHGLSLREFIYFNQGIKFPVISIDDILKRNMEISEEVSFKTDVLTALFAYYKYGYYPFFVENRVNFADILQNNILSIIENDLPYAMNVSLSNSSKIKKMLNYFAVNPGVSPNTDKLKTYFEITRTTILQYLGYFNKGSVLNLLKSEEDEDKDMTKPARVYLNNTNLFEILGKPAQNNCSLEKTFLFNQIKNIVPVHFSDEIDFLVDSKYKINVAENINKDKTGILKKDTYTAIGNLEVGYKNKVPLWMFGFLY